jgi:GrpB-like predicted nucleotidyltransferase (UPF0157 family)
VAPDRLNDQQWPATLGLAYGEVRLAVDPEAEWPQAYDRLAAQVRESLGAAAAGVEHVGSTAVPGMTAKPIIDIAVGMRQGGIAVAELRAGLEPCGFVYRGDAGSRGGIVFVLETAPRHRIAHLHVVTHGDESWVRYLAFRDRLRRDPFACDSYVNLKRCLAERLPNDRAAYTAGKDQFVSAMVSG